MRREARQGPAVAAALLQAEQAKLSELGSRFRLAPPQAMLTVARGSSDHAANYMAYLMMARLGRLVASLPMSVVTLHHASLLCQGLASFAFSQSGQSPDLVAPTAYFTANGGCTVAFVNDADSPLARASMHVVALHAGPERSVAATKSYTAQLVAGAALVAAWQQDPSFTQALQSLPERLHAASQADWTAALPVLQSVDRLYVIARGTGLPVALEAALKFKEVCGIQAEAFSGAEVRHGPMALVEQGFAMLVFAPPGPAQAGLLTLADDMRARGARVLLAAPPGIPGMQLPLVSAGHPDLEPISLVQSFYPLVEALARARGLDPDHPRHLSKVTRTQ
jgi:glucosamine--fructose-6-phosphate aminotransferase (isomerizing)